MLVQWKKQEDTEWLKEIHSQVLQQVLMQLDQAFKDAFSKNNPKKLPRFKKKGQGGSFRYPQGFKVDDDKVFLPKIGWVRFCKSREMEGVLKNITISERGDKWFISFGIEKEVPDAIVYTSSSSIGIDLGITRFATLSNGEYYEPLNVFRRIEKQLAKEQRSLARKVRGSNNWKKQKRVMGRLHTRIANIRQDFLHKLSTILSKSHAIVFMEKLLVANMSKSARGTLENPGTNVAAKSGLNKSILDQGWFEFRRLLAYKLEWLGGRLMLVNPKNTSRTCPVCKYISKENRKTQARFKCIECGYQENADLVAANNILALGHSVLAYGDTVSVTIQA